MVAEVEASLRQGRGEEGTEEVEKLIGELGLGGADAGQLLGVLSPAEAAAFHQLVQSKGGLHLIPDATIGIIPSLFQRTWWTSMRRRRDWRKAGTWTAPAFAKRRPAVIHLMQPLKRSFDSLSIDQHALVLFSYSTSSTSITINLTHYFDDS